jgi:hypothetical protein
MKTNLQVAALILISILAAAYGTVQIRQIVERGRTDDATLRSEIATLRVEVAQLQQTQRAVQQAIAEIETEMYGSLYPELATGQRR